MRIVLKEWGIQIVKSEQVLLRIQTMMHWDHVTESSGEETVKQVQDSIDRVFMHSRITVLDSAPSKNSTITPSIRWKIQETFRWESYRKRVAESIRNSSTNLHTRICKTCCTACITTIWQSISKNNNQNHHHQNIQEFELTWSFLSAKVSALICFFRASRVSFATCESQEDTESSSRKDSLKFQNTQTLTSYDLIWKTSLKYTSVF
jgi:hypothetical protein